MNKKAFSLVEMIVVISIIILVAVIAATVNNNIKTNTLNTRATADLETLDNAFLSYLQENSSLPDPSGNTNYFKEDTSYTEKPNTPAEEANTFGVYGQVTSETLPNRYMNFLPLDQFTGAFYAYGKMLNADEYEVAGVIRENGGAIAMVKGNYKAEAGPYNLIREYNGPNFVYDKSDKYLPYNPDELSLNARITELTGNVTINGVPASIDQVLSQGDMIIVPATQQATLYFGDGSKSVLGDSVETKLTIDSMTHPNDNSLISQIALVLGAGTIWTNATQMGTDSSFNIQTGDTTAAVRGTIFGVKHTGANSQAISVLSGKVESYKITDPMEIRPFTTENPEVESINKEITLGVGELTSTLKTEVVSYNTEAGPEGDQKIVTLKMNDVFRYDADYLKVGDSEVPNPKKETGGTVDDAWGDSEQEFNITTLIPTDTSELELAFCKTIPDSEPVCTRSTSIPTSLSYITKEVDGTPICTLATNQVTQLNNLGYDNLPTGEFTRFTLIEKTVTAGLDTGFTEASYSLLLECNGEQVATINEADEKLVSFSCDVNNNYEKDGDTCTKIFASCDANTSAVNGYKLTTELVHDRIVTGVSKSEPAKVDGVTKATRNYSANLKCNDSNLAIVPNSEQFLSFSNVQANSTLGSIQDSFYPISLNGDFEIDIILSGIPSGGKQFILLKDDLRISFEPDVTGSITFNPNAEDTINLICIDNNGVINSIKQCINSTSNINIKRSGGLIYLNGKNTEVSKSGNYSGTLNIGGRGSSGGELLKNIQTIIFN